jgi:hypothetical protein
MAIGVDPAFGGEGFAGVRLVAQTLTSVDPIVHIVAQAARPKLLSYVTREQAWPGRA